MLENTISNTIYALSFKRDIINRKFSSPINSMTESVVIGNNGSLVLRNNKQTLYKEPLVISKLNHRGLGLYINTEIMQEKQRKHRFPLRKLREEQIRWRIIHC